MKRNNADLGKPHSRDRSIRSSNGWSYLAIPLDKVNPWTLAAFRAPLRAHSGPIQGPYNLLMHGLDAGHAIYRCKFSLLPVIVDQRLSLGVVGLQS